MVELLSLGFLFVGAAFAVQSTGEKKIVIDAIHTFAPVIKIDANDWSISKTTSMRQSCGEEFTLGQRLHISATPIFIGPDGALLFRWLSNAGGIACQA